MPLRFERGLGHCGGELILDASTRLLPPATAAGIRVVERLNGKATLARLGADRAACGVRKLGARPEKSATCRQDADFAPDRTVNTAVAGQLCARFRGVRFP